MNGSQPSLMHRASISFRPAHVFARCAASVLLVITGLVCAQGDSATSATTSADRTGVVRLRNNGSTNSAVQQDLQQSSNERRRQQQRVDDTQPYQPGEFENYVQRQAGPGKEVRRLGSELVIAGFGDGDTVELTPVVPADYVLSPGDEVLLTLWGSVDADLKLLIDRGGRISIPRVGTVQAAGVRYADLQGVITRRVASVFKNFEISVSLGQLSGVRVFVTGFVQRPGAYTVGSLSTVVAALMRAGGPSAAGSFRDIQLRRGTQVVARFDLYDLLVKGDRSADRVVQPGDVVHVGPVGTQVGIIGSVNKAAVLELKVGETVADALRMAGGFSAVAERSRIAVERLEDRSAQRVAVLQLPADQTQTLSHGDLLRAFSAVDVAQPTQRQSKRVRVEGEVSRPAEYILPEGSTIADALAAAGGLTSEAFLYSTEFTRESVRLAQQDNYNRALRELETDLTRANSAKRVSSADDAAAEAGRAASNARLLDRLREIRPTGRIVLEIAPSASRLPDLILEDGDRLYVRARPNTVSVFGSVFNAGSYLYSDRRTVGDYLRLAGGPTRGADQKSVFVIRPNGTVISQLQMSSGWFNRDALVLLPADPGDTVFVPEELDKTTFLQLAKDWTQIFSQFGLGVAALQAITR